MKSLELAEAKGTIDASDAKKTLTAARVANIAAQERIASISKKWTDGHTATVVARSSSEKCVCCERRMGRTIRYVAAAKL
jgi:hypothetical protein